MRCGTERRRSIPGARVAAIALLLSGAQLGCQAEDEALGRSQATIGDEIQQPGYGPDAEVQVPSEPLPEVGAECTPEVQVALVKTEAVATSAGDGVWVQPAEIVNCDTVPIFVEAIFAQGCATAVEAEGALPAPPNHAEPRGLYRQRHPVGLDDDGDGITGLAPGGRLAIRLVGHPGDASTCAAVEPRITVEVAARFFSTGDDGGTAIPFPAGEDPFAGSTTTHFHPMPFALDLPAP